MSGKLWWHHLKKRCTSGINRHSVEHFISILWEGDEVTLKKYRLKRMRIRKGWLKWILDRVLRCHHVREIVGVRVVVVVDAIVDISLNVAVHFEAVVIDGSL